MDNHNRTIIKRIAAALLCALVFVSFMPDTIYAFDEQQEQTEMTADTVDPGIADPETETADPLSADPEPGAENPVSADPEPEPEDPVSPEPEAAVPTEELADDDTLLESYMDSRLTEELGRSKSGSGMRKAASSKRRNKLNDNEKYIYDILKAFIDRTAAGEEPTAKISIDVSSIFRPYFTESGNYYVITRQSLGISSPVCIRDENGKWPFSDEAKKKLFDFSKIIDSLMADEPYAFYWYDKTPGNGIGYKIEELMVYTSGYASDAVFLKGTGQTLSVEFTVSEDYRAGNDRTAVDTVKTAATAQAVTKAADIISAHKGDPDIEKLYSYRDEICALTSYNHAAAEISTYPYGDPWQMIYVFDGDETTNVVCEGYAKAFQYLCDHTQFIYRNIECDSVTGIMKTRNASGGHMWNILHMDDGRNYMADITNSDTGMIGSRGGLFLSKAMAGGTVAGGYKYDADQNGSADLTYTYDKETRKVFSDAELTMSASEYIKPHVLPDAVFTWEEDGSGCSAEGTCLECGEHVTAEAVITSSVKIPATCIRKGVTTYRASFGSTGFRVQTMDKENIPINKDAHSWNVVTKEASEGVAGSRQYTCTRCGLSRTEVIPAIVYTADLPNVKISKPKAGKKKMTVKWKKVSKKNQKKITGIEIQIASDPYFTDIVKMSTGSKKKTSKVIKGLNPKTKYYVRIRAYKNASDGKHVSYWKSKSVKVK